jgi:hypothetical protein
VTPDGRHVISASDDKTLKVWDLAINTCCFTHYGDARYLAVAIAANTAVAGDAAGTVWFLDMPLSLVPSVKRCVTRDELLAALSKLLPSQFEQVLYRAQIPHEHLSGPTAPPALRAVEVMRYAEQQGQLDWLAGIVEQVMHGGGGQAGPGPR